MLKKTISYEDYNGNERTDDFYFNLTKSEILEIQFANKKGFSTILEELLNNLNDKNKSSSDYLGEALDVVRYLILTSYGEKSDDGRHFIKSDEISEKFYRSPAYDALIMEFFTSEKAAVEFFNGIAPRDLIKQIQEAKN